MLPNELNAIIGKRTQSTNDINQTKSRSYIKPSIQKQCRQSELELIFQVKKIDVFTNSLPFLFFYIH
jgi:hypothetical protein